MDSQSNPVFFNTFDPFDNPAPPKPAPPAQSNPIPSNNTSTDNVNSNILMPAASPGSHNPHFFPSPLDSPSINPYPLPRTSVNSSWPSPAYNQGSTPTTSQPPPSYPLTSSPFSSAPTPNSTPSSSVSNTTSPVHSPSLSSVHSYSSQGYQPQAPPQPPQSPTPLSHSQPSPAPSPSPSPSPYSQAPASNAFQSQPYTPPQYPQSYKPYQPLQPTSPTPQQQPQQQQQQQSQSSSLSQSQLQQLAAPATPPSQPTPSSSSSSSSSSSHMPEQTQKILDQIVGSLSTVMTRLDGIDNRISALEIATKEVLNNQRTISTQQRKLQDAVDTPKVVAAPAPAPVPVNYGQPMPYEEPRKQTPVYHPPTMSSSVGPIMPPPPSHHMPSLVPVTHVSNRGERIGSTSGSGSSSYDADLELAKKLQAEFDSQPSSTSSNANSNSSSHASYTPSKPTPSASTPKSGQQECPICSSRVALADLEAHVEQHFEDEEAKRASLKPGEKPRDSKTEAKGFLAKLFGPKEAEEKKPAGNTEPAASTPARETPSNTAQSVPYTHTQAQPAQPAQQAQQAQQAQAYAQRPMPGYYPTMATTPGQAAAMYRPAYYPYPVQGVPVQQGRTPAPAQTQQYLYYPNLDQPPQ